MKTRFERKTPTGCIILIILSYYRQTARIYRVAAAATRERRTDVGGAALRSVQTLRARATVISMSRDILRNRNINNITII